MTGIVNSAPPDPVPGKLLKQIYHRQITSEALGAYFSAGALETLIIANLGQDAVRYQVGHDHFHYDANSFTAGDAYCAELRRDVLEEIGRPDVQSALIHFGRLTHTVQDLYAHSNYVSLWRLNHPQAGPAEINPQDTSILKDSRLHSGRLYYPLEALYFIPALKPLILPLLPRDSHAWMNLDDPSRADFPYAYSAAVKRTASEYAFIVSRLTPAQVSMFSGNQ